MTVSSIDALVKGYREKRFSPVEIVDEYLRKIKTYDGYYSSYITVCEESARAEAVRCEQKFVSGEDLGILCGVPLSYKDNIDTRGIRTTNGSLIDKDYVPTEDAVIVHKMRNSGAILLGKANLHEYAFGITSINPFYGSVKNPWNRSLIAGGSSGGSAAAVAANLCLGSLGTDTAGSIRIPAACCGVVGLKPTYGLIGVEGIMPLAWTLDHAGPITRNVADLALMMEALTGHDYRNACSVELRGLRVGVPVEYFNQRLDPEVHALYQQALRQLERNGAILMEVNIPFAAESLIVARTIGTSEVGYVHHDRSQRSLELYGVGAKETFERSRTITAFMYIDALKKRERMAGQLSEILKAVDVIATPTVPIAPVQIGVNEVVIDHDMESVEDCMVRYTCLFNVTGHPALSIPCGITQQGVPTGLQLVSDQFCEDLLMHVAFSYEQTALSELYARRDGLLDCLT